MDTRYDISLSLSPSFLFIYLCFFYPIVVYIASTCIVEFYNVPRKKKKKNRYGFIPRFINFRLFSLSPLSLSFHCLRFTMKTITRFVLFLFCFLCTISFPSLRREGAGGKIIFMKRVTIHVASTCAHRMNSTVH